MNPSIDEVGHAKELKESELVESGLRRIREMLAMEKLEKAQTNVSSRAKENDHERKSSKEGLCADLPVVADLILDRSFSEVAGQEASYRVGRAC